MVCLMAYWFDLDDNDEALTAYTDYNESLYDCGYCGGDDSYYDYGAPMPHQPPHQRSFETNRPYDAILSRWE